MLQHYFKVVVRNLFRQKKLSLINILGLAIGMSVVILIALWIWNELSFNTYHSNFNRIAKVRQNIIANGSIETQKTVPLPLAELLRRAYKSDFKYVVSSSHRRNHVLASGTKQLMQHGVYLSEEAPHMFSLHMLKGSREALRGKNSIILSSNTAKALFGDINPVNQILTVDNNDQVRVTGVYEELPENTTFAGVSFIAPFELYLSTETWITELKDPWNRSPIQLYVQLEDGRDFSSVVERISKLIDFHSGDRTTGKRSQVILEPMSKWHLYVYDEGLNNSGPIRYVYMFGIIGAFVLGLACINFMNLSTARFDKRAKEIAVLKSLGSSRSQLMKRFYLESILTAIISFAIAIVISQLSLPFFNGLSGATLTMPWLNLHFWSASLALTILVGLIAGSYPAVYLSSFQPVKVLKGSFRAGSSASIPRKILVVLQFCVSITLIICTIVVFRQVQFAKGREAGYKPENLLLLPLMGGEIPHHLKAFKNDLLNTGTVENVATSESTTTDIWGTERDVSWQGKDPSLVVDFPTTGVSVDYGETVGWEFIEGRDFAANESDSLSLVVNDAAVQYMGLKDPVGQVIHLSGEPFIIVGVIKNMIVESPYDDVQPSLYCIARPSANFAVIKLNNAVNFRQAISNVEAVYKKYCRSSPFDYSVVGELYNQKFRLEVRVAKLMSVFCMLSIFISCIGLFGMASFVVEQRKKEISIRKILGSSAPQIWALLTGEFAKLVLISLIISIPVAMFIMNSWLQNYSYRTTLSWWLFVVSGASALFIAVVTISIEAVRAALDNPVNGLRDS